MKQVTKIMYGIAIQVSCLLAMGQGAWAQSGKMSQEQWLQQMHNEELKITEYVNGRINDAKLKGSLKQQLLLQDVMHEIPLAQQDAFVDRQFRGSLRQAYFTAHPEAARRFNPGQVQLKTAPVLNKLGPEAFSIMCDDGDFESGTGSFVGYDDPNTYNLGTASACNYIPLTNVTYNNVGFSNPDNLVLTNPGNDPLTLNNVPYTNNGSQHAVRINAPTPCITSGGVNMLQKSFTAPINGKVKINFSYALVMEDPSHGQRNPFFLARVVNSAGTEVGQRICKIANANDPFFNKVKVTICDRVSSTIVFSEWTCDFIDFDAQANETYSLELFAADCAEGGHFGYAYVDDICAQISCCPSAPVNVKCTYTGTGNKITWDPVPGAVRYIFTLHSNDANCCKNTTAPFMSSWDVYGTEVTVPETFTKCFSYYVNTVCKDSSVSQTLQKFCSCGSECQPPVNLDCQQLANGSRLSWSPVTGAQGYKLTIYSSDPFCCANSNLSFMSTWNVSGTDTIVPSTFSQCFSWYVNTVCEGGLVSETLQKKCSCSPAPPPCKPVSSLRCTQVTSGSKISWTPPSPATNVDHYEVVIYNNDPFCCLGGTLPFIALWNVRGIDTIVPSTFSGCFSFTVRTVCKDGSKVESLEKKCSCSPPRGGSGGSGSGFFRDGKEGENHVWVTASPNPATTYVQFNLFATEKQGGENGLMFYIYDMQGRELVKRPAVYNGSTRIDVQAYPTGDYIYEYRDASGTVVRGKVLIQKQ